MLMDKSKKCEICGNIFNYRSNNQYCCSKECKNRNQSDKYKNKLLSLKCSFCGNEYNGTRHSKHCSECKGKRNNKYEKIKVSICCRICGKILSVVEKNKTKNSQKIIGRNCESCKKQAIRINSEKKTGENNPNYKDGNSYNRVKTILTENGELVKIKQKNENFKYKLKKPLTKKKPKQLTEEQILEKRKKREQTLLALSERMKNNNPMSKKETALKVGSTLKDKHTKGEIKYKKGKENHLWKGNRSNSNILRTDLKEWKQKHLKLSNYCCEICGSKNELEIHHKYEPFREIIEKFTIKPLNDYHNESEEFLLLRENIKEYHKNVIGQVLCVICHAKIDEYRKKPKTNEKDKENN